MNKILYLVVAHGSRDAAATTACEGVLAHLQARLTAGEEASLSYLELTSPLLEAALTRHAPHFAQIVVVPLILFAAGHFKNDLSTAVVRARCLHPKTQFTIAAALGIDADLVAEATRKLGSFDQSQAALIVVGRGSSDPDANGDFCKFVRLVAEANRFEWVHAAFVGITTPLLAGVLHQVARQRPSRIVLLPHLLFAGAILEKVRAQAQDFAANFPWIKAEVLTPIGAGEGLATMLHRRAQAALAGESSNACDTCQYRVPISGLVERVGGLRSLLWTIRHRHVHAQLDSLPHAHANVSRHLFVCHGKECTANESPALALNLRASVMDAGLRGVVRVSQTSCFGRCSQGPIVAVYPDGIWYQNVGVEDAATLFHEHVLHERIVPHLVSAILEP
jgi:sirohydrochlorin ferrochelatase/(2Fe-2S) ferredoxin